MHDKQLNLSLVTKNAQASVTQSILWDSASGFTQHSWSSRQIPSHTEGEHVVYGVYQIQQLTQYPSINTTNLRALCLCIEKKVLCHTGLGFLPERSPKGRKEKHWYKLNLTKHILPPACAWNGFPCESLVRQYSLWDKENFSVRCSYLSYVQSKYTGWAGQTPCSDRNQGPIGKPSNSKDLMTKGGKKTPKPQTALRHCTVSDLPTTSTTHAPTKLALPPKLTYSADPLPQSFKFSNLTKKKLYGKKPMEGTAKCIMIVS